MKFFEKKLLKLSDSERNLRGMLIAEARRCIATPLDDPYTEKMEKKEDFLFGSQQLIRENQMNFTQISEFLGYSSIHYFSRQFKKISGMTPTEYITSIKALSERERQ